MAGEERYGGRRPYAVPSSLSDLHGPVDGVVELPISVAWTGRRQYDLSSPADVAVMYERVIVEAPTAQVLAALLVADQLLSLWRQLYLPIPARQLWESRFPQLAAAA